MMIDDKCDSCLAQVIDPPQLEENSLSDQPSQLVNQDPLGPSFSLRSDEPSVSVGQPYISIHIKTTEGNWK